MEIVLMLIFAIILGFIIYMLFNHFDYKFIWSIISVLLTTFYIHLSGYFTLPLLLQAFCICAIVSALFTFIYNQAYKATNALWMFVFVTFALEFLLYFFKNNFI